MTLLHAVSYVAVVVALIFVTLSLANGLLWLAEVIEEHARTSKTVGKRIVYVSKLDPLITPHTNSTLKAVILFHILLYIFDANLPFTHIAFSIACHLVYLLNFKNFPLINLTSWSFISSCIMVVADHFLWFFYFRNVLEEARKLESRWRHPIERSPRVPSFSDISTFFGICVWLVPLFLFLSLSANDNALPTARRQDINAPITPGLGTHVERQQRQSLLLSISNKAMASFPFNYRFSRGSTTDMASLQSVGRSSSPPRSSLSPRTQQRTLPPSSPSTTSVTRPPSRTPVLPPYGEGSWTVIHSESEVVDENISRRRVNLHAQSF